MWSGLWFKDCLLWGKRGQLEGLELEAERAERRQLQQYQWEGIISHLNMDVSMGMERRDCLEIY